MNTIGIDNNLDRARIRKLLAIGLFASIMTGVGDFLLGFGKEEGTASKERVMKALSDFLRPEFIGRVDEVAVFNQLSEDDFEKIAVLLLNELKTSLEEKPLKFSWTDDVPRLLAKESIGGTRGARDLRNTIRRQVEDGIAAIIVDHADENVTAVAATVKDGKIDLQYL